MTAPDKKSERRSFIYGDPQIATERELNTVWRGSAKKGEGFRCDLCGHRFVLGDYWRCIYTNDGSSASGNPLVCKNCDTPDAKLRWKNLSDDFYSDKFWSFRARYAND